MRLIVTHEQPDFDAVAGLALAKLAHPGATAVVGGDMPDNVKAFLHLYRDELMFESPEDIDLDEVTELIVVDTNDARRLGRFEPLVERVPVTVYDHHPGHDAEIRAAHGVQERVGATATLLTRHLESSTVEIPDRLASLALLAIHEDTGNLSFDLTTADDYAAAAHLMRRGASLEVVREFQSDMSDRAQRELLQAALDNVRIERVNGYDVAVSAFDHPHYVRNASTACNRLLSNAGSDAALLVVAMDGKTLVFTRALRGIDTGAALAEAFGGGGHPGAAFARTDEPPDRAATRALEALANHAEPAPTAREIMSSPVKAVAEDTPVHETLRLLSQFGHNGVPVLDGDGELAGIVSRRDLERALRHDLAHAPVSGFMTHEVVTAAPNATLTELERLVERHNIGRIPIVERGRLLGIVTRTDLLAAHHPPRRSDVADEVCDRLPNEARRVIGEAVAHLQENGAEGAALYLVGGTVRDALLGRALVDLDLAVEGYSAEALVGRLQRDLGGRMTFHAAFGTSTLERPNGLVLDVAGTREEFYPHPGALPEVSPSSIRKDLARRDFTVNAIAVRLAPAPPALIDPFNGVADLDRRTLRVLHPLSFVEDPTRILRGARLAGRLGFDFAESTRDLARKALASGIAERVSRSRLRSELELTFAEPRVAPALERLHALGAVEAIYGLPFEPGPIVALDAARASEDVPDSAYLLALLLGATHEQAEAHVEAFHWPRRCLAVRERLVRAVELDGVTADWLEEADPSELSLLRVLSPALGAAVDEFEALPKRRKLRGRDVIELGLPSGPDVGEVLSRVAEARRRGLARSFDDELELARREVERIRGQGGRERTS